MNYAVIMAGGSGKRLWPLSRKKKPKQLLKILDGHTLLRRCFQKLSPLFDPKNILVLTNAAFVDLVKENLPELPPKNIIAEPVVRDTAGAIGLAATVLAKTDPEAAMAVVTADQLIDPPEVLQQALKDALTYVNENPDTLFTFGIKPDFASTHFGYINCVQPKPYKQCANQIYSVESFKEKPDEQTAKKYLEAGSCFWNSGIFVWKAAAILAYLQKLLPESTQPLQKIGQNWGTRNQNKALHEWFPKLPKISIDFAVMEKAHPVNAIMLDCHWLDVGAFTALANVISSDDSNNVVVAGSAELLDCKNSIIVTEDHGHLIAAIGLDNFIIAHSPDATLVCPANQAQRLKELLDLVEKNIGDKFL